MAWIPLGDRLSDLPLILAGPILRRTEPDAVTVWVALREAREVTLRVYATIGGTGTTIAQTVLQGQRTTVAIGQHLHLVAVTATPLDNERSPAQALESGQVYAYNLSFDDRETLAQAAVSPSIPQVFLSYFDHGLPTFALPPLDLNHLKLVHGSCRKAHGKGYDALAIVDDVISHAAMNANDRPHQLFLNGDQIYGDDVADPLLWAVMDAGTTLLGWKEELPTQQGVLSNESLQPGQRSAIAEQQGGFTAGLRHKAQYATSHLFRFAEYCGMYLFVWSPALWSQPFPDAQQMGYTGKAARRWNADLKPLRSFAHTLWKSRRVLANLPTYMIFDDHDVSDDWYLNQAWCLRVLGKPLGRRSVQNALLAYALFQGWGNTPAQFAPGHVGDKLLHATAQWSASAGSDAKAATTIARVVGLPAQNPHTGLPELQPNGDVWILQRDPDALTWNYHLRSACHEVVVLDTRTWRGYPIDQEPTAPPMLLCPCAFDQQIRQPLQAPARPATFVIAPTNLISLRIIDWVQHWSLKQRKVFDNDVGDAWNIHKAAFATLLKTLFEQRQQVIVLSGDIHYGSAVNLEYWSFDQPLATTSSQPCALAQLTSSAIKNAEFKTQLVHTKLKSLLPERDRIVIGTADSQVQDSKRLFLPTGDPASLPAWQYRIQWILRQPAQRLTTGTPMWLMAKNSKHPAWLSQLLDWLKLPWNNRWLQEGFEVVGRNNIGLVECDWSSPYRTIVSQRLLWYAPWNHNGIVSSRFVVSLRRAQDASQVENYSKSSSSSADEG